jgi:hypothetical protein
LEVVGLENEIAKTFISQGPFAALFVYLLYYVLKTSDEREKRLIDSLDRLAEKLNDVKTDIATLHSELCELKDRIVG